MKRQFLLVENTRAVIQAEASLKKLEVPCRVMPVPRAISSECGMCLEITPPVSGEKLAVIEELPIPVKITELQ